MCVWGGGGGGPDQTPSLYQYWASLNTSLTSLPSLNQDLDNTWKLIPKSKPTFQKNSSEIFEFRKISQRATILALLFATFLGC